jgi:hypothetical protein
MIRIAMTLSTLHTANTARISHPALDEGRVAVIRVVSLYPESLRHAVL